MSAPPKFFYRVLPNGPGWYWEILDTEKRVLDRGVADEQARARAAAFEAALSRVQTTPEPYPESKTCPNTSSI